MLKSLTIKNFRCFKKFELRQLGVLNLLVGENNSGKTSVLEAIQFLTAKTNLENLQEVMIERGEYIINGEGHRELDIRRLYCGHSAEVNSQFSISALNSIGELNVRATVQRREKADLSNTWEEYQLLVNRTSPSGIEEHVISSLSPELTLSLVDNKRTSRDWRILGTRTNFLLSGALSASQTLELFEGVVLTAEEDLVIEALRAVDPDIERIAAVSLDRTTQSSGSRGGFMVRLAGQDNRVPIGNLGDGMWRMLGIILALVNSRDGLLLVDEIDTGLHFSAMSDMWKIILRTARRLNVQVFATTHSSDCWTSLAEISRRESVSGNEITIQRIEKGKQESIVFTEQQVAIAAERGIEVR